MVKLVDKERRIRELEFEDQLQKLDSRHFTDPFRRAPGVQLLPPQTNASPPPLQSSMNAHSGSTKPALTIQTPTPDKEQQSPVKARPRPRQRPVSDQSPGQTRIRRYGVVMDDEEALSAVDAATMDFASLTN